MREPKTWVFGDVHGAYKALEQIFERTPLQEGDTIISLGDIADGWSEVYECVEFLLNLEKEGKYNMIFIKGNHDDWMAEFLTTGIHPGQTQGGRASVLSYKNHCHEDHGYGETMIAVPQDHLNFFKYQHHYYLDDLGNLFIHGGFNRHTLLKEEKDRSIFWWDRDLWHTALSYRAMVKGLKTHGGNPDDFMDGNRLTFKIKDQSIKQVFIGHTTTMMWHTDQPMHAGPIWNLDTGAGFVGRLTMMDIETHDFYQSDSVQALYPNEKGRK